MTGVQMNPTDDARLRSRATITVLLCFLTALFEGVDLQAAGVAAPHIIPLFRLSPQQAGLFFSSSTLGLLAGAMLGGWLADRVGRKKVLLGSLIVFGAFALGTALAKDFAGLVALRLATGVGLGGALPNMIALASESSRPDRRGLSVGLMYCGMPLGGAVASAVNLVGLTDWRTVFYVGGVTPLVLAPFIAFVLTDPIKLALESAGAAKKADAARIWNALFGADRALKTLMLWVAFGFTLLLLYLLLNWLPTLLISRGFSRAQASIVQIVFNLAGAAGSPLAGWLIDGRRRGWATLVCFLWTMAFLIAMAVIPASLQLATIVGGALGLGIIANQALLYAMAPWCYPTEVRGTGVGAAVAVGRFGSLIGPVLAGLLVGSGQGAGQLLIAMLPVIAIGGVAAVILSQISDSKRAPRRSVAQKLSPIR